MAKVYVTDADFTTSFEEEEEEFNPGGHTLELLQTRDEEELKRRASDAEALLVQYAMITPGVMDAIPNLKVIGRYGIGVDSIDLPAAKARGITVVNCPDYCLDEVSDTALTFLLMAARKVLQQIDTVRDGEWHIRRARPCYALTGQTLGLVGFGAIGRRVAAKASGFGVNILVFDPYLSEADAQTAGVKLVSLDTLLAESDYVSLHAPATAQTRHMINAETLAKMKKGAVLINTARGALVDTNALTEAIRSGHLDMAMLDVLEVEPPPADLELKKFPNVVITPHGASLSEAALPRLRHSVARDMAKVLAGEKPKWSIGG